MAQNKLKTCGRIKGIQKGQHILSFLLFMHWVKKKTLTQELLISIEFITIY